MCDNFAWNYIKFFIQSSKMVAGLDHNVFFEWPTFKKVQGKKRRQRKM